MSAGAEPWDDDLAEALRARPTPRSVAEVLMRLPPRWRRDPAAKQAAAEAWWLDRHTAQAFGTPLPAGFVERTIAVHATGEAFDGVACSTGRRGPLNMLSDATSSMFKAKRLETCHPSEPDSRPPRPAPRRQALPWLIGFSVAAAVAGAAWLLRPSAPHEIAQRDPQPRPAPAELRLDFKDSLFALAAPPARPAAPHVALLDADPAGSVRHATAELGARVAPMASSVGKAFAFLGDLPALAGKAM